MNIGRTLALLAAAGVVVLGVYLVAAHEPSLQGPTREAAQPAGNAPAVVAPAPPASRHSPAGAAVLDPFAARRVGPSHRLRQEFSEATDLRAFAYSAMARPHEGGYFYARHAGNLCGKDVGRVTRSGEAAVAKEVRETGTVAFARLQAAEQFQRLCGSFAQGEAADMVKQMNARAPSGEDPLLSTREDTITTLLRKKQWDQVGPLFERLSELNDPLLWTEDQLFRLIVASDPETRNTGGFYFDGKVYRPDESGAAEAWSALELGFCGNGPCALDLRLICLGGGFCGDHAALVRAQYFANGGTEVGWGRVMLLEQRVRAGIEARATEMFVQPKSR